MINLPTVLEFESLENQLLKTSFDIKSFQWPEAVKSTIEILVHLITYDVDDVLLEDNGRIWAKPAVLKNGNGKPDPICLQCMDDRTPDNKYVKDGDFYQMSWHPYALLEKIAHSIGSFTHTAARMDTARILDLSSVDDLSYPFFYGVRDELFYGAPHEARIWPNAQRMIDWSPAGYNFPKFTAVDHPHREWLAANKRYDVWKSLTEEYSETASDPIPEDIVRVFLEQTNVYWWFGYSKEYSLLQKLQRTSLRYQSEV